MSALLGCIGFSGGMAMGFPVACVTIVPLHMLLEKGSFESTLKKVALLGVHAFLAISATATYFLIPQLAFSFVAVRILQGALILPLMVGGNGLADLAFKQPCSKEYATTIFKITMCIGVPALYFGVPLVATLGCVGFARHLYSFV